MKLVALVLLLAVPAIAQTPVATGGTTVIPAPAAAGSGSITPSICIGSQISNGIKSDGTVNCIAPPSATVPQATASTPGAVTLPPGQTSAVLSVPAISGNYKDVSSTPIASASAMQSTPTTYDGIRNFLTGCGTFCTLQIPASYPYGAESTVVPLATGTHLSDLRGGSTRDIYNDPTVGLYGQGPVGAQVDCRYHFNGGINEEKHCRETDFTSTEPGSSLGANGRTYNNWTIFQGEYLNYFAASAGIKGNDRIMIVPGVGDAHVDYPYMFIYGGEDAPADEGDELFPGHLNEAATHYTGTVQSIASDVITSNVSGGSAKDLGVGQTLVNQTTPIATGYITGATTMTDGQSSPQNYTVLAMTGATATPSPWWGWSQAAIDVPAIESTGTNVITTAVSLNFTTKGGSGSPAVGNILVCAFDKPNPVYITSVTAISGGYTLGFGASYGMSAGSLCMISPYGMMGLELTQNTVSGLRYNSFGLGFTDATHLVAVQPLTGNNNQWNWGMADINRYPIFSLTNAGGTTTLAPQGVFNNQPKLENYAAVTISGATNAAFNSTCANVGRVENAGSFQVGSFPPSVNCTQSGASGQTTSGGSPYYTFGTSGYGTGGFILRRMATVVDVQTYATGTVPTLPVVTQTVRVSPNALSLSAGNSVSVDHHIAMQTQNEFYGQDVESPYCANCNGRYLGVYGHAINGNWQADRIVNGNSVNEYAGGGGDMTSPQGHRLDGIWGDALAMQYAPFPSGSTAFSVGPPATPLGVMDTAYVWNLFVAATNGGANGVDALTVTPFSRTLGWTGLFSIGSEVISGALTVGGVATFNGGINSGNPYSTATFNDATVNINGGANNIGRNDPYSAVTLQSNTTWLRTLSGPSLAVTPSTPSSGSVGCTPNTMWHDDNYFYACNNAGTALKRVALNAF